MGIIVDSKNLYKRTRYVEDNLDYQTVKLDFYRPNI